MPLPLLDTPGETPQRGPVQVPGELRALALAQAAERLARRDPAAVQGLGCLHAPVLGDGQQHVEDLRGLQVRWRGEQQRADRHPAGLEVALELRAKRTNLVGPAERVDALIQAALGCRPMLERVLVGDDIRAETTRVPSPRRPGRPGRRRVARAVRTGGRTRTARDPAVVFLTVCRGVHEETASPASGWLIGKHGLVRALISSPGLNYIAPPVRRAAWWRRSSASATSSTRSGRGAA